MSGTPRPRRECPRCHKMVAVHVDGSLWEHMLPGHGMWDPGIACPGVVIDPEALFMPDVTDEEWDSFEETFR